MDSVVKTRSSPAIGIVVIGRNEGQRLARCLVSVRFPGVPLVYVDSGSVDGSAQHARESGVEVIVLDGGRPFCAARARNAGYARLLARHPGLRFVQFIDGDCELIAGWLESAQAALRRAPDTAIVAGWLRERAPEASIYNRLGELEWNLSGPGEVTSVGGIFLIRCEAFGGVGGFDDSVAAGEEPELCQRLRREGWRVLRIDCEMAWHDLAMTRFTQWCTRAIRYGYTSMDAALRFNNPHNRRSNRRVWIWAAWLALVVSAGVHAVTRPESSVVPVAILLSAWPAQWFRIALRTRRAGHPAGVSMAHALLLQIAFLPHIAGQGLYVLDRWRRRAPRLVEYRKADAGAADLEKASDELELAPGSHGA